MLGKILFGLIGIPFGVLIVVKAHYIVNNIIGGTFAFAEKWFGPTGTYTFVRLCGLAIMVISLLIMIGAGNWIYNSLVSPFAGIGKL